ncbi:D-inositol-3-phosphate glycosyltransferase [Xanthomonas sacchari]|uniref:D-inositol-3-phosphate glycosyltransferase n=2 Tax=Xanthomonas sacchari TaxID=56458 RepID=A0ABT3DWA8_9XANT|nr:MULTISPECIES: glycosyltransferase family 4 protein [Xanthomonas]MCW0399782.1 D-inositol-3-phosphate glycosyltransferase [Xanthomonas sacchari]MCW0420713.1 D-inositol-3-phosphate glycosyltransferase [Xanthomonas sacchari]MDQ7759418.1 glycosyltransferase family 4 protein [Xanthomonas sontii]TYD34857.1 hexosyltransferase [Xanthomonas sontii]UYK70776.1 glycosyltransferase family 4 protein [Xanthomonas sacchari]
MKLALVVPGGVDRSGEYRVIPAFLSLIERLARMHELHVFVLHQEPLPAQWDLLGARIHNIGAARTRWRAIAAIRAEHRRAPFDVVQSLFSGHCSLIAVAAARWLRRPSLVHIAGGELVALHAIGYGGRRKWQGRLREALVLRLASAVTAASAPILDSLRALGIAAERVPLGVDLRAWPPRPPRPRGEGPARLLHVASLNPVKDQTTLLRALAALARAGVDFRIDLVGVDTLDGAMQRLVATLGLSARVRFLGFKTQRDLRPLVEAADLLVLSSQHEAGPLVLLEAAVAGVPTVGTAVGHLQEWAPSAALAVPVGDWAGLADALRQVLSDDDLRLRLAWAAQCRALREDADCSVRGFTALYQRLCAPRRTDERRAAQNG